MRLIVFDLDGTLVDSRRDIAESANAVLEECGCAPHSEDAIGGMVGDGAAQLIARAFAAAQRPAPPDALERFLRVYNSRLLRFTRPYVGVPELLDALSARALLAVLTNKPLGATRAILAELGLASHFSERVLGGDGPHPRKPDAAGLAQLMSEAGVLPANTLMVGDSVVDFRTARSAGAHACVARYGFGFHDFPVAELNASDRVIDCPLDLLTTLDQSERPRVLLVDDYLDAREMYSEYLQLSGFDVVEAANGLEALDRAAADAPDIILMDLSLPVMDGWEATRRLKADSATAAIPVVAFTAHVVAGVAEHATEAGCDAFVTKPCLPEDLVREIRSVLRRRAVSKPHAPQS